MYKFKGLRPAADPERTRRFQSLCDLVGVFLVFTYVCVFVSWLEAMRTDGL